MSCWSGLGLNYKSVDYTVISQDISYFNSIGLHYIRPHIPASTDSASELNLWRSVAKTFHDAGFNVQWGVTSSSITSANWSTYAQSVKDQALLCQNNSACDEFGIGNELELHHDGSITDAQIRTNLRSLATEVQAIFTSGPISYQVSQDTAFNGWVSDNNLGDLDLLGINTYGVYIDGKFNQNYKSNIVNLVNTFGNRGYISEFNLDPYNPRFIAIPEDVSIREMGAMMSFIKNSGVERANLYQWRGYKDGDDQFALKLMNGDYKLMWQSLATNNGRMWLI